MPISDEDVGIRLVAIADELRLLAEYRPHLRPVLEGMSERLSRLNPDPWSALGLQAEARIGPDGEAWAERVAERYVLDAVGTANGRLSDIEAAHEAGRRYNGNATVDAPPLDMGAAIRRLRHARTLIVRDGLLWLNREARAWVPSSSEEPVREWILASLAEGDLHQHNLLDQSPFEEGVTRNMLFSLQREGRIARQSINHSYRLLEGPLTQDIPPLNEPQLSALDQLLADDS